MPEFKGFDDWVELFKGGRQVDSSGKEHDGNALIDKAVATFNAREHEPPAVIGHPKHDDPAYGWLAEVKKEGGKLFGKFKDVNVDFAEMVEKGLFKKRSVAFYPDGRIRHVGFLGAAAPAVKGLANMAFEEGEEFSSFEFSEGVEAGIVERVLSGIEKMFSERFSAALGGDGEADSNDINDNEGEKSMDEEEKKRIEEAARAKAEAEFNEKLKAQEEKTKEAEEKASKLEAAREKEFAEKKSAEIEAFIGEGVKAGKILPAWREAGLAQFMEGLDASNGIEFSEGCAKQSSLDFFKEKILGSIPKQINFNEISGDGDEPTDEGKVEKLVAEFMERDKTDYKTALASVSEKYPALFEN